MIGPSDPESALGIRRKLDDSTREWAADLDTILPIDGKELPNFTSWINWNGFALDRQTGEGHSGFDFATYLDDKGNIVFGLPERTNVRVIADGRIIQILDSPEWTAGGYGVMVQVEHGPEDSGMGSRYVHIVPKRGLKYGDVVKKGDDLGTLYKDQGDQEGRLVHLHLELRDGFGTHGTNPVFGGGLNKRIQDPVILDKGIYQYKTQPQGSTKFIVPELPKAKIETVHFRNVRANE